MEEKKKYLALMVSILRQVLWKSIRQFLYSHTDKLTNPVTKQAEMGENIMSLWEENMALKEMHSTYLLDLKYAQGLYLLNCIVIGEEVVLAAREL